MINIVTDTYVIVPARIVTTKEFQAKMMIAFSFEKTVE